MTIAVFDLIVPIALSMLLPLLVCGALWLWLFGTRLPHTVMQLEDEAAIYRMIAEHANDGILIQDIEARILWSNRSYERITGYTFAEIKGRKPQEFILPEDAQMDPAEIESFKYDLHSDLLRNFENRLNRRKDGQLFWNQLSFAIVERGPARPVRIVVLCRDITEQIEREEALAAAKKEIQRQAETDPLTGLANRAALQNALNKAAERWRFERAPFALLIVDLDRFKPINDSYGHAAGDEVLRTTADRIRKQVRQADLVARIGGDEFVVLLRDASADAAAVIARKIHREISQNIAFEGFSVGVGASVGVAEASVDHDDPERIMRAADEALYSVKHDGRGGIAHYERKQAPAS